MNLHRCKTVLLYSEFDLLGMQNKAEKKQHNLIITEMSRSRKNVSGMKKSQNGQPMAKIRSVTKGGVTQVPQ